MSGGLLGSASSWWAPLLAGLALAVWPSRHTQRARRVVAALIRPDPPQRVGQAVREWPKVVAVIGYRPHASPSGRPLKLAPDLVMELVASGLRSGLSVVDALGCAASAGRGPGADRPPNTAGRQPPSETSRSARAAIARAVRRRPGARAPGRDPSAYLDLVVARLRLGVPAREAWSEPPAVLRPLARALVLAELSGAPAAGVVVRAASDARAAARERVELGAARLGVRLVLPLGLAVLPGFVLLAVAPIVLGLAASVIGLAG
jgi:Type II secretion system (T2SS), protein F